MFFRWILTSLVVFAVPYLVPGFHVASFAAALAFALVLGVLNFILRPILVLLTLPLTLLTFGFFLLVINALVFEFAASFFTGIQVDSFMSALLASVVVSLISWVLQLSFADRGGRRVVVVRQGNGRRSRDLN